MQNYTRKNTIQAQQFDPSVLPWPEGVSADAETFARYVFQSQQGVRYPLRVGDYIVDAGGELIVRSKDDFEREYQLAG